MATAVGREAELALLARFVEELGAGPAMFVVEGEAGIGKTTLWRAALEQAQQRDIRVVRSQPLETESRLSFSAVGDLLDGALDDVLPLLPVPQQRALEVATLRAQPLGGAPDQRAVSVAVLGALRCLASQRALLVAIDDAQWLDRPSARAIAYALHRLSDGPVGALVAMRPAGESAEVAGLLRALPEEAVSKIVAGPLAPESLVRILRARLDTRIAAPLLRRVAEASRGNPFYALQIAHALLEAGSPPAPGEPLPVPADLQGLLRDRIERLPPGARDALALCAALARPTRSAVRSLLGDEAAAEALHGARLAGVVEVTGDAVDFTHPLLSAAVLGALSADERRELHRRVAGFVTDPEERGMHLALAAEGPGRPVAEALDDAAQRARARGAPAAAGELSELARRLTVADDEGAARRRAVAAAEYYFEAGDVARAKSLMEEVLAASPPGAPRADALYRLSEMEWCDVRRIRGRLTQALEELGDEESPLRVEVHESLGWAGLMGGDLPSGRRHARAALELAERIGDRAHLALGLEIVGHIEFFMGLHSAEVMDRAVSLQDSMEGLQLVCPPRMLQGAHLVWAGDLDAARTELERDYRETLERGQLTMLWEILTHLVELEVRAGNWGRAAAYAADAYGSVVEAGQFDALERPLWALSLVEAHRGEVEAARAHAEEGLRHARAHGNIEDSFRNHAVLGFLELSLGNAVGARAHLEPLPKVASEWGLRDPGAFPFVPDLVEALVMLGDIDGIEATLDELDQSGRALDRPLARATAARGRGQVLAARHRFSDALAAFEAALAEHEQVPQPLERARTLLAMGELYRRHKQKRLARETLGAALRTFEWLGASLWAQRARAALARIGDRPGSSGDLTETERRVAELVADGRTNREVADALFVSVKTVEANLTRIYHKLGLRSRTELARVVAAGQR